MKAIKDEKLDLEEIQRLFTVMGLGTSEQRDCFVEQLSINMIGDSTQKTEIITLNNTLNTEHYA